MPSLEMMLSTIMDYARFISSGGRRDSQKFDHGWGRMGTDTRKGQDSVKGSFGNLEREISEIREKGLLHAPIAPAPERWRKGERHGRPPVSRTSARDS